MVFCLALQLILLVAAQTSASEMDMCLLPNEQTRLQNEKKLDNRIKIYQAASTRCQSTFDYAAASADAARVPAILQRWMRLLELSLQDIEANADRRKKSKALIRYEIHLRKALSDLEDSKMKFPYEEMEQIGAWLAKADGIRKRFVDILFQR